MPPEEQQKMISLLALTMRAYVDMLTSACVEAVLTRFQESVYLELVKCLNVGIATKHAAAP
jgi:hypothetical protein